MSWEPGPDPYEQAQRKTLAEEGLAHLERFEAIVEERAGASKVADALIAAAGGTPPPGVAEVGPDATEEEREAAEKRLWLAGYLRERIEALREQFEADRDGLSDAEQMPDSVLAKLDDAAVAKLARTYTPIREVEERVEEARSLLRMLER